MGSGNRAAREVQHSLWKSKLDERLKALTEQGVAKETISKDSTVRKLRAEVRSAQARLRAISRREEKLVEMAAQRAEKLAAPKKEKRKKGAEAEDAAQVSKRQQKKKQKKESKTPAAG